MTRRYAPLLVVHRFGAVLQGLSGEAIARRGAHWLSTLALLTSLFGIAMSDEPVRAQPEPKPPATYPALPSEISWPVLLVSNSFGHSQRFCFRNRPIWIRFAFNGEFRCEYMFALYATFFVVWTSAGLCFDVDPVFPGTLRLRRYKELVRLAGLDDLTPLSNLLTLFFSSVH